jgi:hypothetical protein
MGLIISGVARHHGRRINGPWRGKDVSEFTPEFTVDGKVGSYRWDDGSGAWVRDVRPGARHRAYRQGAKCV